MLVDTQTKRTRELLALAGATIAEPLITRDNRTIYFVRYSVEGDIWLATLKK